MYNAFKKDPNGKFLLQVKSQNGTTYPFFSKFEKNPNPDSIAPFLLWGKEGSGILHLCFPKSIENQVLEEAELKGFEPVYMTGCRAEIVDNGTVWVARQFSQKQPVKPF